MDGSEAKEIELESISQWEVELLRERLHELLACADQEEMLSLEVKPSMTYLLPTFQATEKCHVLQIAISPS